MIQRVEVHRMEPWADAAGNSFRWSRGVTSCHRMCYKLSPCGTWNDRIWWLCKMAQCMSGAKYELFKPLGLLRKIATFSGSGRILPFHFSLAETETAEIEGPERFASKCWEVSPTWVQKKERFRNGSRYWIVSIRSCCNMFYQLIEWILSLSQYTTSNFVHTTVSDDWHTVRLCGKEAALCTECLKPCSRDRLQTERYYAYHSLDGTLSQQDLDGWQKTYKQWRKHWMETNTAEARTIVPQ